MSEHVHTDITMQIVNAQHPHYGELCHPVGDSPETTEIFTPYPGGPKMYKMRLINCVHGVDGCYVKKSELSLVKGV